MWLFVTNAYLQLFLYEKYVNNGRGKRKGKKGGWKEETNMAGAVPVFPGYCPHKIFSSMVASEHSKRSL